MSPIQFSPDDLQKAAEELGPFDPPKEFTPGEEFEANRPRPIPRILLRGSHWRGKKRTVRVLFIIAIACLIGSLLPFIQQLSLYILPLQWIDWIGVGLLGITALVWVTNQLDKSTFDYVRIGEVTVGRILMRQLVATGTAEVQTIQLYTGVEYINPETRERVLTTIPAPQTNVPEKTDLTELNLEPGTYVTVVGKEGQFEKTATLRRFLGLHPDCDFLADLKRAKKESTLSSVSAALLGVGIFGIILFGLYSLLFYSPVGGNYWLYLIPVAIGFLGVTGLSALTSGGEPFAERYVGSLALGFFGAIAACALFNILNARFDGSPLELEPIEVINFWQTTHNFVFRDYSIEYRNLKTAETSKVQTTVEQMQGFDRSIYGAFDIGQGRFGLQWIRGIHPVRWVQLDETTEHLSPVFTLGSDRENAPVVVRIAPAIDLGDGTLHPLPETLIDRVVAEMKQHAPDLEPEK